MVAGAEAFLRHKRTMSRLRKSLTMAVRGRAMIAMGIAMALGVGIYRFVEVYYLERVDSVLILLLVGSLFWVLAGFIDLGHARLLERKK